MFRLTPLFTECRTPCCGPLATPLNSKTSELRFVFVLVMLFCNKKIQKETTKILVFNGCHWFLLTLWKSATFNLEAVHSSKSMWGLWNQGRSCGVLVPCNVAQVVRFPAESFRYYPNPTTTTTTTKWWSKQETTFSFPQWSQCTAGDRNNSPNAGLHTHPVPQRPFHHLVSWFGENSKKGEDRKRTQIGPKKLMTDQKIVDRPKKKNNNNNLPSFWWPNGQLRVPQSGCHRLSNFSKSYDLSYFLEY